MDRKTHETYRAACERLKAEPLWASVPAGLVQCHPNAESIVYFVVGADDVSLAVCLHCLRAFIQVGDLVIGGPASGPTGVCRRCETEMPIGDFVARSGAITTFCSSCRLAWGKAKREEELAAAAVAAEAEEQELATRYDAAYVGLQRLERELLADL